MLFLLQKEAFFSSSSAFPLSKLVKKLRRSTFYSKKKKCLKKKNYIEQLLAVIKYAVFLKILAGTAGVRDVNRDSRVLRSVMEGRKSRLVHSSELGGKEKKKYLPWSK